MSTSTVAFPSRLGFSISTNRRRPTIALARLQRGNMSNVKGAGEGVCELKLDWGPGYRVYFGQDGKTIVILLCGGTKKRQRQDIAAAKARWADYKARKSARPR